MCLTFPVDKIFGWHEHISLKTRKSGKKLRFLTFFRKRCPKTMKIFIGSWCLPVSRLFGAKPPYWTIFSVLATWKYLCQENVRREETNGKTQFWTYFCLWWPVALVDFDKNLYAYVVLDEEFKNHNKNFIRCCLDSISASLVQKSAKMGCRSEPY